MSRLAKPKERRVRNRACFVYLPAELGHKVEAMADSLRPPATRTALVAELVRIGLEHWPDAPQKA
jgi:hypothetical protein